MGFSVDEDAIEFLEEFMQRSGAESLLENVRFSMAIQSMVDDGWQITPPPEEPSVVTEGLDVEGRTLHERLFLVLRDVGIVSDDFEEDAVLNVLADLRRVETEKGWKFIPPSEEE